MNKHIRKLSKFLFATQQGEHAMNKYTQMMEHEGWKIHQDCLIFLKGLIHEELLSPRFTKLESTDKDVQQRAYAGINEIIEFLMDPVAKARTANKIKSHNMGATGMGATTGGKT